ncbi:MAG TPA: hypothetical protein QF901_10965, partial [Gammaproteobacteria bacterium]|nr:hypothetical protein [Gammaproteobacteria bacterium]
VIAVGAVALGSVLANVRQRSVPPLAVPTAAAVPNYDYDKLRQKITYGRATLADARRAMTDQDPASLSNSIHAFYVMRRHRGVVHLLKGMWELNEAKYPELSWALIAKPPARIALASTLNRIQIVETEPYQQYIRSYKNAEHEFIRAQVAVALGFNGDPVDLSYLKLMSDGDNHYVAQSAITGLSLFGGERARDVLIELAEKHRGTPRGDLMVEMLRKAYRWSPPKDKA